jgi:HEAT repeat protein
MLDTMRNLPLALMMFAVPVFSQQPSQQATLDRAWQVLNAGLQDSNPAKRVQDVAAMGILRPQAKAVSLVESAFADKDYSIRQAACVALEQMKSKQSIPKLHEALNDTAPVVVFAAAKALYAMGDPMGREVLVAVLLGDQADSAGFFASSIHDMKAKIHDPKALVLIGVKEGASAFLGPAGYVGIPAAEGLLKDSNASGKTVAAALLSKDTQPETMKAIRQALEDKNWTVRAASARALALADRADAFDAIAVMLDDNKVEVHYSAAAALIRLKQPSSTPRTGAAKTDTKK